MEKTEFEIFKGMDIINRKMAEQIEKDAPICHMKKMILENSDSVDGYYTSWWECSICGHTKDL